MWGSGCPQASGVGVGGADYLGVRIPGREKGAQCGPADRGSQAGKGGSQPGKGARCGSGSALTLLVTSAPLNSGSACGAPPCFRASRLFLHLLPPPAPPLLLEGSIGLQSRGFRRSDVYSQPVVYAGKCSFPGPRASALRWPPLRPRLTDSTHRNPRPEALPPGPASALLGSPGRGSSRGRRQPGPGLGRPCARVTPTDAQPWGLLTCPPGASRQQRRARRAQPRSREFHSQEHGGDRSICSLRLNTVKTMCR